MVPDTTPSEYNRPLAHKHEALNLGNPTQPMFPLKFKNPLSSSDFLGTMGVMPSDGIWVNPAFQIGTL